MESKKKGGAVPFFVRLSPADAAWLRQRAEAESRTLKGQVEHLIRSVRSRIEQKPSFERTGYQNALLELVDLIDAYGPDVVSRAHDAAQRYASGGEV